MVQEFEISFPCSVPILEKKGGRRVDEDKLKHFWKENADYAKERGVYIFYLKVRNKEKPYYVGKTNNSFEDECFTDHKLKIYNNALIEYERSFKPYLILLIPKNKKGQKAIKELEDYCIEHAWQVNPDLQNKRGKPPQFNWRIRGINDKSNNAGAPTIELRALKRLLFVDY